MECRRFHKTLNLRGDRTLRAGFRLVLRDLGALSNRQSADGFDLGEQIESSFLQRRFHNAVVRVKDVLKRGLALIEEWFSTPGREPGNRANWNDADKKLNRKVASLGRNAAIRQKVGRLAIVM